MLDSVAKSFCDSIAVKACRTRRTMHLLDDAKQEAYIGYWKASQEFDPSHGVKQTTHAYPYVTGAVADFFRSQYSDPRRESNDFAPRNLTSIDESPAFFSKLKGEDQQIEQSIEVKQRLAVLKPRWKEVIDRRYYLGESGPKIAKEMGLTPGRIEQINQAALLKMRHIA